VLISVQACVGVCADTVYKYTVSIYTTNAFTQFQRYTSVSIVSAVRRVLGNHPSL